MTTVPLVLLLQAAFATVVLALDWVARRGSFAVLCVLTLWLILACRHVWRPTP